LFHNSQGVQSSGTEPLAPVDALHVAVAVPSNVTVTDAPPR
jgi:hypothetical protein